MLLCARGVSVPSQETDAKPPLKGPVDLAIAAGDALALSGPSGSGKTTLLRALCLLEPLTRGQVLFEDKPVAPRDVPRFRRRVQLLPQAPARLPGSVHDNLTAAFSVAAARGTSFDETRARALLGQLGLGDVQLDQPAERLSGGEAQRLALVRALLTDPQVLLLDEPTASLDSDARSACETAIMAWKAAGADRALVLVSHDPEQRARLATHHHTLSSNGTLSEESPR